MPFGLSIPQLAIICATVVAIVAAAYFIYKRMAPPPITSSSAESFGGVAELILFTVDWCPHCKTAKPEWDSLVTEYSGRSINGYSITFTEVNCTDPKPDVEKLMNQYKVEGFPTIKLIKNGSVIDYDAKPTKDTLLQFLNTSL